MKKYIIKMFISFALTISTIQIVSASVLTLLNKTIIIDVGHGGKDHGTSFGEILEKDINLLISKYLHDELIKRGANVILIRNSDYDLSKPNAYHRKKSDFDNRIKLINNSSADLYLSIHLNYLSDANYYGPQIFYDKENDKLATTIQNEMNRELNGTRSIKTIPTTNYMYSKLNIPGVLIECGFLSNKSERDKLVTSEYQQKIAKSITNSLEQYF